MTRLAYILAASHSGSTLLSMLLASHPQVGTIGEMVLSPRSMGDLRRYRCSCGQLIRECSFWQEVIQRMAERDIALDLTCAGTDYRSVHSRYAGYFLRPLHQGKFLEECRDLALGLSLTWRRQLPEIHRRNAALAATIAAVRKADVIVDSSKTALRLKYLLRNSNLEIKVIHLVRDGRAVSLTYMDPANFADAKDPAHRGGGMGGDRENERLSMAEAAYEWRRSNEEAEHLLRGLSQSQWIEVRYEDYCRNPHATLNRLYEFLEVERQGNWTDFRSIQQHVVGNGMRLDLTSEVVLDEKWRCVLTPKDLETFDHTAGRLNRYYGYQ